MINVEDIEKLIKYALISGRLKDEKQLSLLFISTVETGKTTVIRKHCLKCNRVFYTTDATAYGIIKETNNLRDIEERKFTHIVIPDLIKCTSRKQSTVNDFISFMNSLIEEGVVNISTYATKVRMNDSRKIHGIKCGLITSIAYNEFTDHRSRWSRIGFISRLLPVSYSYKDSTVVKIFDYINDEGHLSEKIEKTKISKSDVKVKIPEEFNPKLSILAITKAKEQKLYGFRFLVMFRTLLKSIALFNGRKIANEEDMKELERLLGFVGFEFIKI